MVTLKNLSHKQIDTLMTTIASLNILVGFGLIIVLANTMEIKYLVCIGLCFDIHGFIFIFMARYTRIFWIKHDLYRSLVEREGYDSAENWVQGFQEEPLLQGLIAILIGFVLQIIGTAFSS